MDAQKFGTFIATVRKEKGMTQADLAKALNVTDKAVSKWERGLSLPDINNFEPLAEALGVSIVELFKSERLENEQITPEVANSAVSETVAVARERNNKLKKSKIIITVIASIFGLSVLAFLIFFFSMGGVQLIEAAIGFYTADVYVETDIDEYQSCFLANTSVFPENPQEQIVEDFKYVFYDPWDSQELAYIVIVYDFDSIENELNRLALIGINDEYKELYSVTGINEKYNLLAMLASDNGFIYAMQDRKNENRIVYVYMNFYNDFYDLKYEKYIPNEYLPVGFNAHIDNPYRQNPKNIGGY